MLLDVIKFEVAPNNTVYTLQSFGAQDPLYGPGTLLGWSGMSRVFGENFIQNFDVDEYSNIVSLRQAPNHNGQSQVIVDGWYTPPGTHGWANVLYYYDSSGDLSWY